MMDTPGQPVRRGFSLIELLVVMVLLAVMASLATLTSRAAFAKQSLELAAATVEQFDRQCRADARLSRRGASGQIDPSRGQLIIEAPHKRTFRLSGRVVIDRFVSHGGKVIRNRQARIQMNEFGTSPSYAVRLVCGDSARWIFISGGSGQIVDNLDGTKVSRLLVKP
ncbi:prepilin-type N-terminal cleavage/methylation domain-containing protein [Roseiconus lacunae]|uniref:prepilin-type N-terminal cleavage/methylation domain-containing protein n=1 Tax=Roseiconus lacunae TaxID=2605694 RepID=UPI003091D450|nr:prepilin-type N-terminal cleavage/methylation domain-containing protein [Stieleria sp. HD01]